MKLKLIPINEKKVPLVKDWQSSSEEFELNGYGVGLVCGKLSDNIEAIDIDLKYDLTGTLLQRYSDEIKNISPELLSKLVVQKTVSGGYHFIYRCNTIEGNKKLAQREATEQEKINGDKIKVLIETRGEGGYIAIQPTQGYRILRGSLETISTITEEEREILFNCAMIFNEVIKKVEIPPQAPKKQGYGLRPGDDYDERGDVVSLLNKHGWKTVGMKGSKVLMLRPGQTSSASSGNFDTNLRLFSVFTTSSEFNPQEGYTPFSVYAKLECNGDFVEAARQLYNEGFGDRNEDKPKVEQTPTRIDLNDGDFSFLASKEELIPYLNKANEDTFEKGKPTGFQSLDEHFLFKKNLLVVNGHDNVGKSVLLWYLRLLASLLHGERSIIFTGENSEGFVFRKLIEFYYSKNIRSLSKQDIKTALDYLHSQFAVIKNGDRLYNYADILNLIDKANTQNKYDFALIDPYNSLDVVLSGGLSEHAFHYKTISEIKLFQQNNKMGIGINTHAITESLRRLDSEGYTMPPNKADTEGGGKFSNKSDDFLTFHRITNHPSRWMDTQIHVRKIKETESGGKPTQKDSPVIIQSLEGVVGFIENRGTVSHNPVQHYWDSKSGKITPNTDFDRVDYEDDMPF